MKTVVPLTVLLGVLIAPSAVAALPTLDVAEGAARAAVDGDTLAVTTGVASRVWKWTGQGLATVSLKDHPVIRVDPATSNPALYEDGLPVEPVKPGITSK